MASLSPICSPNVKVLKSSFLGAPSVSFASPSPVATSTRAHAVPPISCKATSGNDGSNPNPAVDRRNVLLGGLYGATSTLIGLDGRALASPIAAPELTKCIPATIDEPRLYTNECCPPYEGVEIVDFTPPKVSKLRIRHAAQDVKGEELEKYEAAVKAMRELPDDDPRSWTQQAKVHCAYCNFGYKQTGAPELGLQVHFCWLFLSFHRWYLYFHEKILGKLIGDPDFAMPYWNWDAPEGMVMPAIFTDPESSLYDKNRDPSHYPPTIIDFDNADNDTFTDEEQIADNLAKMYNTMVSGGKKPVNFFGEKYVTGSDPSPGSGTLENMPHNIIHVWVGNPSNPKKEDMGNFYSAGYDPLFYCHHQNVDRMWSVWKQIDKRHRDFRDPEYLEASFLFYDENKQLVRVKVKDSLETETLGYKFQEKPLPWLKAKPKSKAKEQKLSIKVTKEPSFPLVLKSPVVATVKRPKKSRSLKQKEDEEEVLLVRGIELDPTVTAKFDVYINAPDSASVGPGASEYAGTFVNVPQRTGVKKLKTNLKLAISELLDDIKADDDDSILVSLVPRRGKNKITIGGLKIEFAT